MVMSYKAGPELGIIEVHTTNEGGHSVDFWAKRCIERIIAVSEDAPEDVEKQINNLKDNIGKVIEQYMHCLLYTSPSPRDGLLSRMPSSA